MKMITAIIKPFKLDDVRQEDRPAGGAPLSQTLSTVQNAVHRTSACPHRLNPQKRIQQENFMTYLNEFLAVFKKKGA